MMTRMAILLVLVVACASPRAHTVRFSNAPVVTAVSDHDDVPKAPKVRPFAKMTYHFHRNVVRTIDRRLGLRESERAVGVNAVDEVPDSTWFTNRIGVRDVAPDEIRNAGVHVGSPEAHLPWTIKSTKVGGVSVGFQIVDARGEKFILKFDLAGFPEMESAADAIVGRLLWAAGFNIAEDHVVYFRRSDLVLAPNAEIKDWFGNKRRLTRAELDKLLARVDVEPDGRLRGLASKLIPGTVLGGHPDEGMRPDDPNDRVPHERRRENRGAKPIFSWLDHVDVKEDNTLDVYQSDSKARDRHFVRHYWIDYGKSLGVMASTARDPRRGHSYRFDISEMFASIGTAGLYRRSWETRTAPTFRGLGLYDVDTYNPGRWTPDMGSYLPFRLTDHVDGFWGAKIVMRFTREQMLAAIEAGRFSDSRTAQHVLEMMIARQRETGRYWFSRIAPLDRFVVDGTGAMSFEDLLLAYELAPVATSTRYQITTTDRHDRPIGSFIVAPDNRGHVKTPAIRLATDGDNYTIVRIRTTRTGFDRSVWVHLARRDGGTHVVGIWRE
jgi:hypothetical protein